MLNGLTKLILTVLLVIIVLSAKTQPYLIDNEELLKLKTSKLYVIMNTQSGIDDKYIDVFKNVWNYCPYEIIDPSEVNDLINPDVFFMNVVNSSYMNIYIKQYKEIQVYDLLIWTVTDTYVKSKDNQKLNMEDLIPELDIIKIAKINLKSDDSYYSDDIDLSKADFLGSPYLIYNGSGILKNYLMDLQTLLTKKQFFEEYQNYYNYNEIANLKRGILYFPEEILKTHQKDSKSKEIIYDLGIFKNYQGKYKLISMADLNERINEESETYYYVSIYMTLGLFQYQTLTVTNSYTGEIIFKESVVSNRDFPPKLIKNLSETINN